MSDNTMHGDISSLVKMQLNLGSSACMVLFMGKTL